MSKRSLNTYSHLCTDFYDLEDHVNHDRALSFYMQHAQQAGGAILEPMCGSGRFLIPLLQAGLPAEGFDASLAMLTSFKEKFASISDPPIWQQFVQDFQSSKLYRLIFIPYGSWGLITDQQEAQQSLKALYDALDVGGKLIIEIETIFSVPHPCGVLRRGTHTRPDGSVIALSFIASYDDQTQLFKSNSCYQLIIDNDVQAREHELFEQYLYRVDEFDQLLQNCGFVSIKKYPAFDSTQKIKDDTPIIIYECLK